MKKLIGILGIAILASCAPGKSSKQYRIDIYCDSCYVKVGNEWSEGSGPNRPHVIEIPFEGMVVGQKSVMFNKFDSPNSCARLKDYTDYAGTGSIMFYIEESDTVGYEIDGGNGYCY